MTVLAASVSTDLCVTCLCTFSVLFHQFSAGEFTLQIRSGLFRYVRTNW